MTSAEASAVADASRARDAVRLAAALLQRYSFSLALLLTVALLVANLARTPRFGWTDQLATLAPLAVAAMASTPAVIGGGGGFDLSISPIMILTAGLYIVWLEPAGLGGAEAVVILLAVGAAIGAANGTLINVLRIPPVVVTLSTFFIIGGANLAIIAQPQQIDSTWIQDLAGTVWGLPGALFTIGFPLAVWAALGLLPYRRALYAVGSNDATAFASGVNVALVRIVAYSLGGLFAAVGGFAVIAVTSTANGSASETYTLLAIAALALGGTSLWGGRGGLIGSAFGAASLSLIGSLFVSLNVNPEWLQVIYGLMLLFAVVVVGGLARPRRAAA